MMIQRLIALILVLMIAQFSQGIVPEFGQLGEEIIPIHIGLGVLTLLLLAGAVYISRQNKLQSSPDISLTLVIYVIHGILGMISLVELEISSIAATIHLYLSMFLLALTATSLALSTRS